MKSRSISQFSALPLINVSTMFCCILIDGDCAAGLTVPGICILGWSSHFVPSLSGGARLTMACDDHVDVGNRNSFAQMRHFSIFHISIGCGLLHHAPSGDRFIFWLPSSAMTLQTSLRAPSTRAVNWAAVNRIIQVASCLRVADALCSALTSRMTDFDHRYVPSYRLSADA